MPTNTQVTRLPQNNPQAGFFSNLFWRPPSSVDPNADPPRLAPAEGYWLLLKIGVFGLFTAYNVRFFLTNGSEGMRWPTAIIAVLLEVTAFWCTLWWSRSTGKHRGALFFFGIAMIILSASHAAIAYYQMQPAGVYDAWTVQWYVHVVAFPLIFCTLALASLIVPALHWEKEFVRDQVLFEIDIERDKAALRAETAMMESESQLEEMKLHHMQRQGEIRIRRLYTIKDVMKLKGQEQEYIGEISDPYLRAEAIRLIAGGTVAARPGNQNGTYGAQSAQNGSNGSNGSNHTPPSLLPPQPGPWQRARNFIGLN